MSVDARALALALGGAVELPHHGFPSFRVNGRIFATMPNGEHLHVMLDPDGIREAVALDPDACEEKWWGSKLSAVRVNLERVDAAALEALLTEAWRMRGGVAR